MRDIQLAIRRIIERFIAKIVPLTADASIGDTTLTLQSTRRFVRREHIVVYSTGTGEGEVHEVTDIVNSTTMTIGTPLVANHAASDSYVQKLLGFEAGNQQFLNGIYIGDPSVIMSYPAITIDAKSESVEWMTLESTRHTYEIDITVYVLAADFESQYDMMHAWVKAIKNSLFRSFYPLVDPYTLTTLAEDVTPGDTLIKITDEDLASCMGGWIWLENYDFLRWNKVIGSLGNGVLELSVPIDREFEAGDNIIRPRRHIFNTLPRGIQYGTVNKESMLKAAVISYTADEEIRRYTPFIDPLTF